LLVGLSAKSQLIFTVAGNGTAGYGGDSGLASAPAVMVDNPIPVAIDTFGNIFLGDYHNSRVRKINAVSDTIRTVAGNGMDGYLGNGGLATSAKIDRPNGVAVDDSDNIYIADDDNEDIRKVYAATGIIETVAGLGPGTAGYGGDGGPATLAHLDGTYGVAVDSAHNIYICDYNNNRVRKVTASTGIINTIAGTGVPGYNGDGIAATSAEVYNPYGIAVDKSGNVFIGDRSNNRVRKIDTQGIIHTLAGNGTGAYNGDGVAATSAELNSPLGVAVDAAGNVYIADESNDRIRKIVATTGLIETLAGTGTPGYNGDSIPATTAEINNPCGVAVNAAGNVYFCEYSSNRVREIIFNDTAKVNISASSISVCSGDTVTFAANAVNGGTTPSYQWRVNGVNTGPNSSTYITSGLTGTDTVTCVMTSNAIGVTGSPATSNPVIVSVAPAVTASVNISASDSSICPGTVVNFTAAPTNGGNAPVYQWNINGVSAGIDSSLFSSASLINNDTIVCVMTSNAGCVTGSPASSAPIVITVTPITTASVTISVSDTSICPGNQVIFTATPANGGSVPIYQWQINSADAGTDSASFNSSALNNNDTVRCVMTLNAYCVTGSPAISNAIVMSVGIASKAGTITSPQNPICEGISTWLTVNGSSGNIQWQWSSIPSGFENITAATDTFYPWTSAQTTYFRVVAQTGSCIDTSVNYELVVNPTPAPPVLNVADSIFCSQDSTLITAEGPYSHYRWNDGDTLSYTHVNAAGGYWVTVTDTSGCATVSGHANVRVYPVSSVSIVSQGDTLSSFDAVSYQWFFGDSLIEGATSDIYVARKSGYYSVLETDSNGCKSQSTATYIVAAGIQELPEGIGVNVYPNPFGNYIFIRTNNTGILDVEVYDVLGRTMLQAKPLSGLAEPIMVNTSGLPEGVYLVKVNSIGSQKTWSVIKQ